LARGVNVGAGVIIGAELAASGIEIGLDMMGDQFFDDAAKPVFSKISTWSKVGLGAAGGLYALLGGRMSAITRIGVAALAGHMIAEIPKMALAAAPANGTTARARAAARGPSRAAAGGVGVGRAGRSLPGPVPPGRVAPEEAGFPVGQSWGRYTRTNGVRTSRFAGR
jgi:hypothetical protein